LGVKLTDIVEDVAPQQATPPVLQVTEPQIINVEPPVQETIIATAVFEEVIYEEVEAPVQEAPKKNVKKNEKTEKQKQKEQKDFEKQTKLNEKQAAAAAKEIEKKKKDEEAAARAAEKLNSNNSKSNISKPKGNSNDKTPSNTKADMFCKKGKEPCIAVSPQAKSPAPAPKKASKPSVSVKPFTHNGVRYYMSADNILYDKSGNPQGQWNESTKSITPIIEEEEPNDEEEESDEEDDNSEEEEEEYEEEEEQGSARYASKNSDLLEEIEYYECFGSY
jgi:hypothetical protein